MLSRLILSVIHPIYHKYSYRMVNYVARAGCVCIKDGKILLVESKRPCTWVFPAGKIKVDESDEDAAVRETVSQYNVLPI